MAVVDTGEELARREGGARAETRWTFEGWKRTVERPGAITLGPSNRDPAGQPVGLDGIAAKAL